MRYIHTMTPLPKAGTYEKAGAVVVFPSHRLRLHPGHHSTGRWSASAGTQHPGKPAVTIRSVVAVTDSDVWFVDTRKV